MTDTMNPAPAATPAMETLDLETPIIRGDEKITSLKVRKPQGGEMRGLNLQDVMSADVNALIALLQRITIPPVLPHEAEAMDLVDLLAFAGAIRGFFTSKKEQAMLAKIMGMAEAEMEKQESSTN